ncbi:hypothetical protein M0Q28_02925 [Patescibacteria group bacterium]|jgi:guanylate kinase|nr:hypothetical protein [Patescibacteria group bacterium]
MARGQLFVLVGTTGAGKTELSRRILQAIPGLQRVRSCTTRTRREGEPEDAYHFLTREEFLAQVEAGRFVEHDEFGGNLYGRRFEDFHKLGHHALKLADMTESGVLALQARPEEFPLVCIKITPVNKTRTARDDERAADDAKRRHVAIRVDHEILNDHGSPDGLANAYREFHRILETTLFPEG